ncbi:nitrate regulatory protein [Burkholderia ambifaria]|uniref:nitrate regulatory protein n=2 Tax=Burkholderia ambifaria TaxID=152480 RepID=UPI001F494AFB|nr:nitrate regulatory protein [Burkholderia ambifaria]
MTCKASKNNDYCPHYTAPSPRRRSVSTMPATALQFALLAKHQEIASLRHLAEQIELVDLLGRLIHALQRERGATSIYLASSGKRFVAERAASRGESAPLVAQLRERLDLELTPTRGSTSRLLSLIAWVLLDLESLDVLREQIDHLALSAPDSVQAFSTVIGGLVELIFQFADSGADPSVSRMLIALVHVVEGKEEAGQERAVGAHMFAAGTFSADQQQRLLYLIAAQERSLEVFASFASTAQNAWWETRMTEPHMAALEKLRRVLCTAHAGDALDAVLSEAWFDAASARIDDLWHLQIALTLQVQETCNARIDDAHRTLRDSERLMAQLRNNPPPHTQALAQFFAGDPLSARAAVHELPGRLSGSDLGTLASLKSLLASQSARLAGAEVELDAARRALYERKLVQRAKNTLMTRFSLREDEAYRMLQKASMDGNRPLADIAEDALTSPERFVEHAQPSARRRTQRSAPETPHDDGTT